MIEPEESVSGEWAARRTELFDPSGLKWQVLSLPDLVQAKKTQRDKDWPMIRALLEAHYFAQRDSADRNILEFRLCELRTPEILIEVAARYSCRRGASSLRPPAPDFRARR